MPLISVTTTKGTLNEQQRTELAEKLSRAFSCISRKPGMVEEIENPAARSISQVIFHEVEPSAWAVGGKFDDSYVPASGRFLTVLTVPDGPLNPPERKERAGGRHSQHYSRSAWPAA